MKRTKTTLNPAEFPAEIRPCLAGAEIWDSSCSPEARVWYIVREGGLFLKNQAAGMLKEEAVMTAYFHALGLSTIAEGKPYATVKAVVSMFGVPDASEPILGFGARGSRGAGSESAASLRRPSQRSGTP